MRTLVILLKIILIIAGIGFVIAAFVISENRTEYRIIAGIGFLLAIAGFKLKLPGAN